MERRVRAGQGSAEDVTALAAARAALNSAQAQARSILSQSLTEGGVQVSAPLLAQLNMFAANKLLWDVPERYLGDERSEAQWVELRDALANETIALRRNLEPDPAAQEVLQAARATLNSLAAAANLENLADITQAWLDALEH